MGLSTVERQRQPHCLRALGVGPAGGGGDRSPLLPRGVALGAAGVGQALGPRGPQDGLTTCSGKEGVRGHKTLEPGVGVGVDETDGASPLRSVTVGEGRGGPCALLCQSVSRPARKEPRLGDGVGAGCGGRTPRGLAGPRSRAELQDPGAFPRSPQPRGSRPSPGVRRSCRACGGKAGVSMATLTSRARGRARRLPPPPAGLAPAQPRSAAAGAAGAWALPPRLLTCPVRAATGRQV